MLQTPEYHQTLAEAAGRTAESMEAGAANPRLPSQDRARYAELARGQRRIQAYQEEAAKLAEQGIEAPDWIAWHTHRIREEKAAETAEAAAAHYDHLAEPREKKRTR